MTIAYVINLEHRTDRLERIMKDFEKIKSIKLERFNIQNKKSFDEKWINIKNWLDNNLDKWDIFNGGPTAVERSKYLNLLDKDLNIVEVNIGKTAHFVYYNKNSFDKILKWNPDDVYHIDDFSWDSSIKIVTTYPYLATQYNTYSDIVNDDINYNRRFLRSQRRIADFLSNNQ